MTYTLIVPMVMLVVAFIGSMFWLWAEGRSRKSDRRVVSATLGFTERSASDVQRLNIRRQNAPDDRPLGIVHRLLRYNPEASHYWPAWRTFVAGAVVAIAVFWLGQFATSIGLAMLGSVTSGTFVIRWLFAWQYDRYADRLLRQLPDTIQLMISALRAGMPLSEAFRLIRTETQEPTRGEFARMFEAMALGGSAEEALLGVYRRSGVREYAILSVCMSVQARSGGTLAETLAILADTVRERIALAGRAVALSGEARLTSNILTVFPFLMGGLLFSINPENITPLFLDPRGRSMLTFAAVFLLIGNLVMRHMVKQGTAV